MLTGAGLVSGGVATALYVAALDKESSLESGAAAGTTTQRAFEDGKQAASTLRTASLSAALVGGTAVGVGVYLLLNRTDSRDNNVSLLLAPNTAGLSFTWSF